MSALGEAIQALGLAQGVNEVPALEVVALVVEVGALVTRLGVVAEVEGSVRRREDGVLVGTVVVLEVGGAGSA